MATIRVQVFYQRGEGDKWTNVYHLSVTDLAEAISSFTTFMKPTLLDLLSPSCRIVKVLASSLVDDTFIESAVETAGTSGFTDSLLPFFNCAKVLVGTASLGRPDVKFMKGWLTEAMTASGVIDPARVSELATAFNEMISDLDGNGTPLVADDAGLWGLASVQPNIQMRQMHRRRKRTTTP